MKEELVKKFLQKGKLLSPEVFEKLLSNSLDESMIVNGDIVISSRNIRHKPQVDVKILKNITHKKTEATTEDFARFYRSRYEKMVKILTGKLQKNFISLNKIDSFRNEIYVVGMVKDIQEKENKLVLVVEDLTGSAKIVFEKGEAEVDLDDTVAIKCVSAGSILYGKQIIYPDVPLRQPKTGTGSACFISDLNLDEAAKQDAEKFFRWFENQPINILFVAGDIGDKEAFERYVSMHCIQKQVFVIPGEKDSTDEYPHTPLKFDAENIISLSNPAIIEINGIIVLLIHQFGISMLKKRYLGKTRQFFDEDPLVLENVPDIVCFGHANDSQVINYKSITLVTSGSLLADFRPVIINLETREAQTITI